MEENELIIGQVYWIEYVHPDSPSLNYTGVAKLIGTNADAPWLESHRFRIGIDLSSPNGGLAQNFPRESVQHVLAEEELRTWVKSQKDLLHKRILEFLRI